MIHILSRDQVLEIPEAADVEALSVGMPVQNCFGAEAVVTSIHGTGVDIHGAPFVCFYSRTHDGFEVSDSWKVGRLNRTVPVCALHTSRELDAIEHNALVHY